MCYWKNPVYFPFPCAQETACGGGSGGGGPLPSWISISPLDVANQEFTLTVDSNDPLDAGTHTLYLQVGYDDYPNLNLISSPFDVTIAPDCSTVLSNLAWVDSAGTQSTTPPEVFFVAEETAEEDKNIQFNDVTGGQNLAGTGCEITAADRQLLIDPNNDGNYVDYNTYFDSLDWAVPTKYAELGALPPGWDHVRLDTDGLDKFEDHNLDQVTHYLRVKIEKSGYS